MATCPRCGVPAPDEGRFCRSCGGYLATATSGVGDDDTQRMPVQSPDETRPRGIPAIDDEDVPPPAEEDAFDAARLPMTAYPVEAPLPDWDEAPDQGWYQDPDGQQAPPQPGQGFPPAVPPPFAQQPPFGQALPAYGGQGSGGYQPRAYERAGYYPYDESPGPQKRGNGRRTAILATVGAVALVALVVGGVLFVGSRGHGTVDAGSTTYAPARRSGSASSSQASSAATPQQEATAVNQLLNRAVNGKSMLTTAYGQALSCKISPADAATQFEQAAKNRRAIVSSARRLDTSKLPNGARIRQLLITMYGTSARADDAFADWARAGDTAGDSCLKGNAKRTKGNSLSVRAGKQKKRFTEVWNPVARTYHQPQRTEKSL